MILNGTEYVNLDKALKDFTEENINKVTDLFEKLVKARSYEDYLDYQCQIYMQLKDDYIFQIRKNMNILDKSITELYRENISLMSDITKYIDLLGAGRVPKGLTKFKKKVPFDTNEMMKYSSHTDKVNYILRCIAYNYKDNFKY